MSPKSTIFLLAFLLVVAELMGLSVEELKESETHEVTSKVQIGLAQASFNDPSTSISLDSAPDYDLPDGFAKACVAMCASYCTPTRPKRTCMRTCTACCAKYKCVPEFSTCCEWGEVTMHGNTVMCPSTNLA